MPITNPFKKKKPTIPVSLDQWYANPTYATELRELLNNDTFRLAIATLMQANLPTGLPKANALGSAEERMAWLSGYSDLARDLVQLTKPRAEHQELVPWGHIKPTQV